MMSPKVRKTSDKNLFGSGATTNPFRAKTTFHATINQKVQTKTNKNNRQTLDASYINQ